MAQNDVKVEPNPTLPAAVGSYGNHMTAGRCFPPLEALIMERISNNDHAFMFLVEGNVPFPTVTVFIKRDLRTVGWKRSPPHFVTLNSKIK